MLSPIAERLPDVTPALPAKLKGPALLPASDVAGAPGEIRTPYPLVRSQVLYPDELRALCSFAKRRHYTENAAAGKPSFALRQSSRLVGVKSSIFSCPCTECPVLIRFASHHDKPAGRMPLRRMVRYLLHIPRRVRGAGSRIPRASIHLDRYRRSGRPGQ